MKLNRWVAFAISGWLLNIEARAQTMDILPAAFEAAEAAVEKKSWSCTVTSITTVRGFPPTTYSESFNVEAHDVGKAKRIAKNKCDKLAKEVKDKAKDKNVPVSARCKDDASCIED